MKKTIAVLAFVLTAGVSFSHAEEIKNPPFDTRLDVLGVKTIEASAPIPAAPAAAVLSIRAVEFKPETSKALKGPLADTKDATPIDLNCSSWPGDKLCRQFTAVNGFLNDGSTGFYLVAVWKQATLELNGISSLYNNLPPVKSASPEIGQSANTVAKNICDYQANSGTDNESKLALAEMVLAMNSTMTTLVDIQKKAGLESVKECRMEYN